MAGGYIGTAPADRDPVVGNESVTTGKLAADAVTEPKIATTGTASATTFLRGDMSWQANAGGDVVGPASSTDDALAKFDSTTGKIIQNSTATLSDAGTLTATAFSGPVTGNVTGNIDGIVGGTTPAAITGTQVDITAQGDLRLQDTTGGEHIAIQAAGTTTTYTLTMPAAVATTTGQALTSSTGGVGSWTDVGDALLAADQNWSGSQRAPLVTDNDGSFDQDGGNNFFCTPSGNVTLTFTNHTGGQSGYILFDNAGAHTVSLHANTKGDANLATTLSTAGTYLVSYLDNGTNAYLTTSAVFA